VILWGIKVQIKVFEPN